MGAISIYSSYDEKIVENGSTKNKIISWKNLSSSLNNAAGTIILQINHKKMVKQNIKKPKIVVCYCVKLKTDHYFVK